MLVIINSELRFRYNSSDKKLFHPPLLSAVLGRLVMWQMNYLYSYLNLEALFPNPFQTRKLYPINFTFIHRKFEMCKNSI